LVLSGFFNGRNTDRFSWGFGVYLAIGVSSI
jgi:hypothetical protein